MTEITSAEGRFDEIATVNTHKAPELMSCFVRGYAWCVEHATNLTAEAVKAETAANFRKAEIILEEVPRILLEKGISGKSNADYRDAIIAMDKQHIILKEQFHHIEMYRDMFKGKMKTIELAYMAVRKVFGSSFDFSNRNLGSNHSPSSYTEFPAQDIKGVKDLPLEVREQNRAAELPPPIQSSIRAGFGKAKY